MTDLLLRSYPGIFDQAIPINERKIAAALRQGEQEVRSTLSLLNKQGIISYSPNREGPQIYFIQPRQRTEDLRLDPSFLQLRKQQFERRAEAMISYAVLRESCRSQWLSHYFGDSDIRPCGQCDNCIRLSKPG
jgi:ATP-dependent DNA helicase RecQ